MKNLITLKGMSLYLIVFSLFLMPSTSRAQQGKISQKVNAFKQTNSFAKETALFSIAAGAGKVTINDISKSVKQFTLLDVPATADILAGKPAFLNITVPVDQGSRFIRVLLYKESISANGFTLLTSDGKTSAAGDIVHYKGAVDGEPNSVAAFSFSNNEVMAFVTTHDGNYVIGKLPNGAGEHIIYNDRDLVQQAPFDCGTNTDIPLSAGNFYRGTESTSALTTKCVNWYWETDVDIFTAKGSLAAVNTYMQGVFNQVQTLYANDGISITLKTLYVWTTTDPYTGTSTSGYLDQFGAYRTTFDGDLASLIGTKGGGGIAWINGLCSSQNKYKMAYCGISTSYSAVPNYSWTVECITHEQGHLLGSRHTHDCAWNGNSTKIDGCGDNAGYVSGTCANPGNPTGGGTIMSYCHLLSGVGINFNLGFGPQPKALIVNNVNNASCLVACNSGCTAPDQPAAITGSTTVCATTIQTYSVTAVAGATSYTWSLPSGWSGSSTTNSITATVGTNAGNISVTAVNSCGSGSSRILAVTVSATPSQPASISGNAAVCAGTAQTYAVTAVPGATGYTWTLPSGWSGSSTTNAINATAGSAGGNISVTANNTCGSSSVRSLAATITAAAPAQPGTISGAAAVCPGGISTYSVGAVPGASSYTWTLPSGWSGSSTTNTIAVTAGSGAGNISVSSSNGCGTSAVRTLAVAGSGSVPATPGAITVTGGSTNVCTGETRTYSVIAAVGVSYNWSVPTGVTINSGQSSNSISVTFAATFVSPGVVSVTASNSCGTSAATTTTVTKGTIAKPSAISVSGGTAKVCPGDTRTYTVTAVAGITYNWTAPAGGNINSGQGSNSVSITYTANFIANGTLGVTANNQCGTSVARSLAVAKNTPTAPGAISGPASICTGSVGTYSVAAVTGATGYNWTIPAGGIAQGSSTGSTINILWTGTRAGTLAVRSVNACGTSGSKSLKVVITCPRAISGINMETNLSTEVYPNPTNDIVHIKFWSKENAAYTFTVTDIAGRKVLTENKNASAGANTHQLNLSRLSKGTYLILLQSKGITEVLKINVQ